LEDGQAWFNNEATKMNSNYEDLLKNHDVSMREIKGLQTEVYETHQSDIKKLFEEKMDNNIDLNTILEGHHNNEEESAMLAKFENLLGELDRRVLLLGSECRDDLDKMKHKTDKKIDFLHKWIVKYVGTALKDENNGHETDIGTIRCLVCNHPSKKMDTDTPFVVPDFRNTLGYFHDENQEHEHTGHGHGHGHGQTASPSRDPKYRTGSPPHGQQQDGNPNKNSSSKFAKLRSVPGNSAENVNEYPNNFVDRVDITDEGGGYSGPRTISDKKTAAFYNDMTRLVD
jgi:hypothetical protein